MKRVEVTWLDAIFRMEDHTMKEARKLETCKTKSIGLLVCHNDKVLTIAQSYADKHVSEVLTIPAGMVVGVREIG